MKTTKLHRANNPRIARKLKDKMNTNVFEDYIAAQESKLGLNQYALRDAASVHTLTAAKPVKYPKAKRP